MAVKTFAAINVGSYELTMKIFECSKKNGLREIDHIRHYIELGTDTYATGKISNERVDELCRVLREFSQIMETYQVEEYKAYGTSAIRETENTMIILDQIRIRTGMDIEVLSNSEQRFLDYKSTASKGERFQKIIEKGTAIIDIGGGSIQISLFDKDSLVTTQNIRMGVLRLREKIGKLNPKPSQVESLVEEMVNNHLALFKKLFLKDREIKNIVVVDDYVSFLLQKEVFGVKEAGYIGNEDFARLVEFLGKTSIEQIARRFAMPEENVFLTYLSSILIKRILESMGAELVWAPGVTLCDGIAYEYAEKKKLIVPVHDFEKDIIECARNISKRYEGSRKRGETLEQIALTIFDSMKKVHGLGKRERLLLQLASLLHDCGKYISLSNVGECSYGILMSTEIIGISHIEREIVANIVKYNHKEFDYYAIIAQTTNIDKQSYLTIAKLTAILRIANGLDRSHKQKFRDIRANLKDNELWLTVFTNEDITLEKGLLESKENFFEEVFSVRPVIKQRRSI